MLNPFEYTRGNPRAKVLIVGEAWGENEALHKQPFVGASGFELSVMLKEAGINEDDCLFTNVVHDRPPDNDMSYWLTRTKDARDAKMPTFRGLFCNPNIIAGVNNLAVLIDMVKPSLIIALGNWPLWALTDEYKIKDETKKFRGGFKLPTGIDTQRGSMLYTRPDIASSRIPVLPTYHPAALFRTWKWRPTTVHDLKRVREYFSGQSPWEDHRDLRWLIKPSPVETKAWVDEFLGTPGPELLLTLDLETYAGQIHVLGARSPYNNTCICVPFMDVGAFGRRNAYPLSYFVAIALQLRRLLTDPRVRLVGQNIIYDIQYLEHYFMYTPKVAWDTMIAQHILFAHGRKSLDYMASIYCKYYRYWKEDRKVSLANEDTLLTCRYNCLDLEYTHEVYLCQKPLIANGWTRHMEEKIELLHILFEMMVEGNPIDTVERRRQAKEMEIIIHDIESMLINMVPPEIIPPVGKTAKPWWRSDTQLTNIVYDGIKVKPVYHPDTGSRTLNKEALSILQERVPELQPFWGAIALKRSADTFKENFYDSRIDEDNRIRCEYNPAATVTGRLASSENVFGTGHNLTNVPRERNELTVFNAVEELQ
jgi:uracil-DNA glycosylase